LRRAKAREVVNREAAGGGGTVINRTIEERTRANPGYYFEKLNFRGGSMVQEQRRSPRYPFFASAELIEDKSDVRITTRLSELGLYGCYLDMMNPFPAGTSVLIKISEGESKFESRATVVYSQPNMGMGVAFQDVEKRYLEVLQKWMAKVQP
jgi:PilZ domain